MTDTTFAVEALPRDFGRISRCLARAFDDDPVSIFLFPNARTRQARLASLYRLVLEAMSAHGRPNSRSWRRSSFGDDHTTHGSWNERQ